MLQIYHQKKEAQEQALQQQQQHGVASVHQDEDKTLQHARPAVVDNTPFSEIRPGSSEPHHGVQKEPKSEVATSKVVRHGGVPKLGQQTVSSSLPAMQSTIVQVSKAPQSFPDRLASIHKQKQIEESKTFARSCVRALKVSTGISFQQPV